VAAPAELEDLVEEFRPAIAEIVRRLVLDVAREESVEDERPLPRRARSIRRGRINSQHNAARR
jgi:hypothetical protein